MSVRRIVRAARLRRLRRIRDIGFAVLRVASPSTGHCAFFAELGLADRIALANAIIEPGDGRRLLSKTGSLRNKTIEVELRGGEVYLATPDGDLACLLRSEVGTFFRLITRRAPLPSRAGGRVRRGRFSLHASSDPRKT